MKDLVLNVRKLGSKAKNKYVYKDISFNLNKGEIVGLLGHNGAGKSTILRNISNMEIPQEGYVEILNQKNDINKFNDSVILIPDEIQLYKNFTIKKQIDLITYSYGYDKKFLEKYLKKVNLKESDVVGDLSKGNQEILQLIIMLSTNADLYLLDEPFSALDIFRREIVLKMLIEVSLKEKTIVVTTHLIKEIETILTRVLYLNKGQIIIDKEIEEIQLENESLVEYLKIYFKEEVI